MSCKLLNGSGIDDNGGGGGTGNEPVELVDGIGGKCGHNDRIISLECVGGRGGGGCINGAEAKRSGSLDGLE